MLSSKHPRLSEEDVEQRILHAIERCGADYSEVRIERSKRSRVFFQRGKLTAFETANEVGGVVRCLKNGGWGVAVFNDLAQLEAKMDEAERAAALVGARSGGEVRLTDVEPVRAEHRVQLIEDFRTVPMEEKKRLIEHYDRVMCGVSDEIHGSNMEYKDIFREFTFANSEGSYIVQELPDITLMLGAMIGTKDGMQIAFEPVSGAKGFEIVRNCDSIAETVGRRVVKMAGAPPVRGGQHTVILDPDLAGVFIHEAFGHFCEADFLFKNPQLADIMTLGHTFGSEELQVVDEGYLPGERGNVPYDDEGVPRTKTYLIKHGKLHSLLHSRETAASMGGEPTGNARATSYEYAPIVRMTNTYIENGSSTFAEMLKGIDHGIYACGAFGGQTEFEQFSFSAGHAYEIIDGEIGGPVRNVVLSGNLFETLRSIDRIGDDLQITGGVGGCGKGGQSKLAVTVGSPHIRIQNVTIGGE